MGKSSEMHKSKFLHRRDLSRLKKDKPNSFAPSDITTPKADKQEILALAKPK